MSSIFKILSKNKVFKGYVYQLQFDSAELKLPTVFSVYVPPTVAETKFEDFKTLKIEKKIPTLYWL